jgi:ribosomal protein L22
MAGQRYTANTKEGHFFHPSLPIRSRRHFNNTTSRRAEDDKPPSDPPTKANPFLEQYLKDNPNAPTLPQNQRPATAVGDLAPSSIFEDDRRAQDFETQRAEEDAVARKEMPHGSAGRNPRNMAAVVDPKPEARARWERRKIIQLVKKGGRLSKAQMIKRTEREHLSKSYNMKTSVKKLGALARQIQGKTIDDAITQMRFSKKKVAGEVMKQLEFARDEAVVMRGMGLAGVNVEDVKGEEAAEDSGSAAQNKKDIGPVEIQLKDGKRHSVTDRSNIYIDQAWVGRGPYGTLPDYRARGRLYLMRTPWTSISLLLKEESTRIREHEEREAKRRRQKIENVWTHLPDRPIQTKSQWYSW